jgi:transposase
VIRPDEIWLVVEPVDMRGGVESLSQRVQNLLGRTPCDGAAYAFRNRRGSRMKLLIWDGTGVWLCHRRLHQGHFVWPTAQMTTVTLTARRWDWLVTGVEWQRLDAPTSPASRWNGWTLTMTQQLA